MERIKKLNRYQKAVLLVMAGMVLVFTLLYLRTTLRVGFRYMDTILVPSQEEGNTVYSGRLRGQPAQFTVSPDKTVVFQWGDRTWGPYTVREDPAAVPKDEERAEDMTGVELRRGEDVLFRGGVLKIGGFYWLFREDGTLDNVGFTYSAGDGIDRDVSGEPVDPVSMEPAASELLALMDGPELVHDGTWMMWLLAVLLCAANTVQILFVEELFRWQLSFQIRHADSAEPSDWEIGLRYVGWTGLPLLALVLFVVGLR